MSVAERAPSFLKQSPVPGDDTRREAGPAVLELEAESEETGVLCRHCRHRITGGSWAISVNGAHHHVFANPHGLVFDILCYSRADGCHATQESSDEFTWFPGYRWHIALCRVCAGHLGWKFVSREDLFYGLAAEYLILP
jgi:hypothetical protein